MAEQNENQEQEKVVQEKLLKQIEEKIENIVDQGVSSSNIDVLSKLVDIEKDLCNEKYWKIKEEECKMNYNRGGYGEGNYSAGSYGRRGVAGSGRGRYSGSYGRRGVPGTGRGRYRGEEVIDEMYENYGTYSEASESMYNGNYGAEGGMIEATEGIMRNVTEIIEELCQDGSPEVMKVIKKYSKKISEME